MAKKDEQTPAAALSFASNSGLVDVDYQREWRGSTGRRTIAEMCNNGVIGGLLLCLHNLFRTAEWHVDPAQGADVADPDMAAELAAWTYRTMTEMGERGNPLAGSWDAFLYYNSTALEWGFSYTDLSKRIQSDGTVGIGAIVNVHPTTTDRWQFSPDNLRVEGLWQYPPNGGGSQFCPMERAVLFTPQPFKGSVEGQSILRPSYQDYYYYKGLVGFRAILAERLCGFPVVTANSDIKRMADDTTLPPDQQQAAAAVVKSIEAIGPNIKVGKQGSVTLWTKPYQDVNENGALTYSSQMQLDIKLLTPSGGSAVDYDAAIRSHEMGIARSVLATFLLMGGEGTSGAQNGVGSQYDAFIQAAEANLAALAGTLSSQLIPMLWRWNGYDERYMPTVRAGRIDRASIESLGRFVESMARAGIVVNDPETQEHLRREAGMPIPESINDALK